MEAFTKTFFKNLKEVDFENKLQFSFKKDNLYFLNFNLGISQLGNSKGKIGKKYFFIKYKTSINSEKDKRIYELSNVITKETITELKEQFLNGSFEVIQKRILENQKK